MALSLLIPAVSAPKAEAVAKPKLSAKSVKVTVGAKKKVTVKKVEAKKIKKTTWSLPKKGKKDADCLYSYDVVNEYLHSVNAEKDTKNITYWGLIYGTYDKSVKDHGVTLRPSYVKDAFKYAHEMLVKYDRLDVKLIYNDYNCYQNPKNIIHLVDYINSDGKVCDGIGMQSHLDITDSFHSATNYAKALEYFRLNCPDLEIQITELDATMVSTEDKPLTDEDQVAFYAVIDAKKQYWD